MSIPITLCPAKILSAKVVPEPQNGSKMVLLVCPAKYLLIAHLGICGMNLAGYLSLQYKCVIISLHLLT
jgi:hypothetical protein